ncbi:hypothetical protein Fmac_032245 [Flemingia macrophylla]|uniref:CAND6/7 N-terminal domain-containing protein n=1 Tax=Flemingia macrophylla TaxID=520843 RepID=A0ABD1L4C3_9FABA
MTIADFLGKILGMFSFLTEGIAQSSEGINVPQVPNGSDTPSFWCIFHFRHTLRLFTFRVLSPPPSSSFNRIYPVTTSNEYSLFFANCNPDTAVSMSLRALQPQLYPHLPLLAHTHLPSLFFLFSVTYFFFFAFSLSRTKHFLLLANALNLLSAAALKHRLNLADTPRTSDHILLFLSLFARVVLLFAPCLLCRRRQPRSFAQTLSAFPHRQIVSLLPQSTRTSTEPDRAPSHRLGPKKRIFSPTPLHARRGTSI